MTHQDSAEAIDALAGIAAVAAGTFRSADRLELRWFLHKLAQRHAPRISPRLIGRTADAAIHAREVA